MTLTSQNWNDQRRREFSFIADRARPDDKPRSPEYLLDRRRRDVFPPNLEKFFFSVSDFKYPSASSSQFTRSEPNCHGGTRLWSVVLVIVALHHARAAYLDLAILSNAYANIANWLSTVPTRTAEGLFDEITGDVSVNQ